ncbi:hypothetical protein FACS189481_6160 [Clostridia bacterium]|nr:hypothetical protein FACS189481_6160 [Clostridia bacterium]
MGGIDSTKGLDVNDLQILSNLSSSRVKDVSFVEVQNDVGTERTNDNSFAAALKQVRLSKPVEKKQLPNDGASKEVKFSKHAREQLFERKITLSLEDKKELNDEVAEMKEKGVSLAVMNIGGSDFIVAIPAKMVITAVNRDGTTKKLYTNIDGAYF